MPQVESNITGLPPALVLFARQLKAFLEALGDELVGQNASYHIVGAIDVALVRGVAIILTKHLVYLPSSFVDLSIAFWLNLVY